MANTENDEEYKFYKIKNGRYKFHYFPYRSIILPLVLYGCDNWSLTLTDEYTRRLRVYEGKMLKKIFGSKRREVTGEWKKCGGKI